MDTIIFERISRLAALFSHIFGPSYGIETVEGCEKFGRNN